MAALSSASRSSKSRRNRVGSPAALSMETSLSKDRLTYKHIFICSVLLRLQGVYPEARGSLSESASAFLLAARSVSPQQVGDIAVPHGVLRELENVHRGLISMHLEKTLKSDRVLRDLRRQTRTGPQA